jgi:D-alanyl-D-alanine carboxypeptidase
MRWRPADGRVPLNARLKPGGLRNVVSVAGTVNDAAGQPVIVVVILNHDNARAAVSRPLIDAVLEWVSVTRFAQDAAAAGQTAAPMPDARQRAVSAQTISR